MMWAARFDAFETIVRDETKGGVTYRRGRVVARQVDEQTTSTLRGRAEWMVYIQRFNGPEKADRTFEST